LYGLKPEEWNSEKAREIGKRISPITYLDKGDPPAFLFYTHNVGPLPATTDNEAIHNPAFGVLLKEQMDKLGIECIFRQPKDYPPGSPRRPFTKEMVEFFVKSLAATGQ
jgi:hypothetical protein